MVEPKDPWSDEQLQSSPAGPPDTTPWKVTIGVVLVLAILALAAYFMQDRHPENTPPTSPAASDR
jgi:hypothetical protein